MIDGMVERYREEIGQDATVVACGGVVEFILPHCKQPILQDRNLLLDGLKALYDKTSANPLGFGPAFTGQTAPKGGQPSFWAARCAALGFQAPLGKPGRRPLHPLQNCRPRDFIAGKVH